LKDRRPIIAGNWKMNLDPAEGAQLATAIREGLAGRSLEADVLVAPTFLALSAVAEALTGSGLGIAGQNLHPSVSGAFTGEVSGPMLRAAGADWVILGHSERRAYFGETDAGVAEKASAAFDAGLLPILCLGESLEARETGRTLEVVLGQTEGVLEGLAPERLAKVVLAYEPIWAIGTGRTATPDQVEAVHAAIRKLLSERFGNDTSSRMRILYGGSVKPGNVAQLMACEDVDGALVGGASLRAESFLALIPPYRAS